MKNLKVFDSAEFGSVRTMVINNEPWFVGKDITEILGYADRRKAVAMHTDEDDRMICPIIDSLGRKQETTLINESGLYSLILSSKLPNAKKFKRWVTSEVLPALRKTGSYTVGQPTGKELLALAIIEAQKTIEEQKNRIAEMKPKALFADAVSTSDSTILVGELAKLLSQNGIEIGQNRLFKWLRENGYLLMNNEPSQYSMDLKLFKVLERTINNPDGSIRITRTTKVTGKGQQYFINKFLASEV